MVPDSSCMTSVLGVITSRTGLSPKRKTFSSISPSSSSTDPSSMPIEMAILISSSVKSARGSLPRRAARKRLTSCSTAAMGRSSISIN